jgi:hypothetical protein
MFIFYEWLKAKRNNKYDNKIMFKIYLKILKIKEESNFYIKKYC